VTNRSLAEEKIDVEENIPKDQINLQEVE